MLVIHPSSLCDVCLDPYNISSTPANVPHAIACGHIFCLTCLLALSPSACPLCRKVFQPDRVKKLHVAGPPESDDVTNDEAESQANALLQRVALVSGENVAESDLVEVVTEVDRWLATEPSDVYSVRALHSSVDALQRYKALQDKYAREKLEHRHLRHQLRSTKRSADQDLKTARAVEENLLARIQEIDDEHATELSRLRSELDAIRSEPPRARNVSNPLPPPPEPLPFERLPLFARPGGIGDGDPLLGSNPQSYNTTKPPRGARANTTGNIVPSGEVGPSHVSSGQVSRPSQSEHSRAEERNRRVGQSSRDVADSVGTHSTRRRSNSSRQQPAADPGAERFIRANEFPRDRGHIIPGAHPTQRVIPTLSTLSSSPPEWARSDTNYDRFTDVEDRDSRRRRDRVGHSHRIVDDRPVECISEEQPVNDVETRMASASAYLDGYGWGYDSGFSIARGSSAYRPAYHDGYMSEPPMQEPREQMGGLGLSGVPHSLVVSTVTSRIDDQDTPTPMGRPNVLPGRLTATQSQRAAPDLGSVPFLEDPAQRAARGAPAQNVSQFLGVNGVGASIRGSRTRPIAHNTGGDVRATGASGSSGLREQTTGGDLSSPGSVTSWGTVNTVSRGSLSDLELIGLQNGGVRGQGSVASDISLIGRDASQQEGETNEVHQADDEAGTPMMQGATIPYANGAGDGSVLGLILESEGDYTRDNGMQTRRRSISYTNRLPVVDDRQDSDSDRNQRRAERESRPRQHRRHTSLTQTVSVESESSRPREQDVDTMFQNVNALALSFDASLSLHGTTAAPRLNSFPDNVYRPDIVAPTPIVGGPNVLHMWASRP